MDDNSKGNPELDAIFSEGDFFLNKSRDLMRRNVEVWVLKELTGQMADFLLKVQEFRDNDQELNDEDINYLDGLVKQIQDMTNQLNKFMDHLENVLYNKVKNLKPPVSPSKGKGVSGLRKLAYYRIGYSAKLMDKLGYDGRGSR